MAGGTGRLHRVTLTTLIRLPIEAIALTKRFALVCLLISSPTWAGDLSDIKPGSAEFLLLLEFLAEAENLDDKGDWVDMVEFDQWVQDQGFISTQVASDTGKPVQEKGNDDEH